MLTLCSAKDPFDHSLLDTPGGFAWWYLDLVDTQGNALVLIWFFGLPFLPENQSRAPELTPRQRPGIALAAYQKYKQRFYLLQEFAAEDADIAPGAETVRIGKNRFSIQLRDSTVSLSADIETPMPGSGRPLTGTVRAQGRLRQTGPVAADLTASVHQWTPMLTNTTGQARLSSGSRNLVDLRARAYLDRNASAVPLSKLNIANWRWGRIAFPDRELVYYALEPSDVATPAQSLVLSIDPSGRTALSRAECQWQQPRRDLYGLRWHRTLVFSDPDRRAVIVRYHPPVDTGPFYLRFLIDAECRQSVERGSGLAELVRPDRIDLPRMRPFVQMRIHRVPGPNSPWLPLFCGAAYDRFQRLLSHLARSGRDAGVPP